MTAEIFTGSGCTGDSTIISETRMNFKDNNSKWNDKIKCMKINQIKNPTYSYSSTWLNVGSNNDLVSFSVETGVT